jgi:hypothetical protein
LAKHKKKQLSQHQKQKRQEKRERRAVEATQRFEAGYGSKSKVAKELVSGGFYKNETAAKRAVEKAAKEGKPLPAAQLERLRKQGTKADKSTVEKYRREVLAPREARGKRSAALRKGKESLSDLGSAAKKDNEKFNRTIGDIKKSANRAYDSGVVQFGDGNVQPYAVVVGTVTEYHKSNVPEMFVYKMPLYTIGYTPTGRRTAHGIISPDMSPEEIEEAIREQFAEVTNGGELKAFRFVDEDWRPHGHKKKSKD